MNFSARLDGKFIPRIFRACFSRASGPPKNSHPKFTPKIVGNLLQFQFFEPQISSCRFLLAVRPTSKGNTCTFNCFGISLPGCKEISELFFGLNCRGVKEACGITLHSYLCYTLRKANVAVQLLQCKLSKNCSITSVFACGVLQGWGFGLADLVWQPSLPCS